MIFIPDVAEFVHKHVAWNFKKIKTIQKLMISIADVIHYQFINLSELILGLHPASERHYYTTTPSLIGWAQT